MKLADLDRPTRVLVMRHVRHNWEIQRKLYTAWEADVEEWRAQGYRPRYCVHGRSMWVDHDIACGTCEEHGYYWDPVGMMRDCLDAALRDVEVMHKRRDILGPLFMAGAPISADLYAWASEPFRDFF